jgi:hypothetical protein
MKPLQPQKGFSHEVVYRIRLRNLYYLFGGVIEACDEFSPVRIRTHTQTEYIYGLYYKTTQTIHKNPLIPSLTKRGGVKFSDLPPTCLSCIVP